jgi:hypothetical protein
MHGQAIRLKILEDDAGRAKPSGDGYNSVAREGQDL